MADPLHYERADECPPGVSGAASWWPATIVLAGACVVAAGCAWSRSTAALGERTLPPVQVWAARCTAVSFLMAGQAVLLGVCLPAIYRTRTIYSSLAASCGLIATLCGVSAAALWLATR